MNRKNKIRFLIAVVCVVGTLLGTIVAIAQSTRNAQTSGPQFDEITFRDFGVDDGVYTYGTDNKGWYPVEAQYSGGYANKTFVGTINFAAADSGTELIFAGTEKTNGIRLYVQANRTIVFECKGITPATFTRVIIQESEIPKVPIGQNVEIKLSTEITNLDDDGQEDDVRFWLYFGGTLYKNAPIEAIDHAQYLGNYLTVISGTANSVRLQSKEPSTPVVTAPEFDEITFSDFGAANGEYSFKNGNYYPVNGTYAGGYANKTLVGTINFSSAKNNTELHFTGTDHTNGVRLYVQTDSSIVFECLKISPATFERVIIPASALSKVPIGQDVEFKLITEVTNLDADNQNDDVRFWLYIDETLCNNGPIEAIDHVQYLGNNLTILTGAADHSVTIKSKGQESPTVTPPTFDEITFTDFGAEDGTYSFKNGVYYPIDGKYAEGFANKTFVGTINFSAARANTELHFTGTDKTNGIRLYVQSDNSVVFECLSTIPKTFTTVVIPASALTKVPIGQDVELKLSTEVTNLDDDGQNDDVRFWLYFDGNLYNNGPIEAIDHVQYLGEHFTILTGAADHSVSIKSKDLGRPIPVVTPPTFDEITFSDFGVADGVYSKNGSKLSATGKYKGGYANKTFVGIINYSSAEQTRIHFAGQENGWNGIQMFLQANGIRFQDSANPSRFDGVTVLTEEIKQIPKDKDVELRLSFEVTDLDNDGEQDDVRFWLSFDGELYKNKPLVEAIDYAQYLGNYLGIYSNNAESSVTIKSVELKREVDFSLMGFTKDYANTLGLDKKVDTSSNASTASPNTGDVTSVGVYLLSGGIAVAVILLLYFHSKKKDLGE